MLWNDKYFLIAAELEEPHVCGTLMQHDSVIFHDNDFELFIDPDGDCHNYGEFEINALNTGWDLRLPKPYKDGGHPDDGWEIKDLKTAVHVDGSINDPRDVDQKWTIEIAIPWSVARSLSDPTAPVRTARRKGSVLEGYDLAAAESHEASVDHSASANAVVQPPRDGDQWRVNFSRVEWQYDVVDGEYHKVGGHREDNWVWSPQWTIDMHRPETWGYVQFSSSSVPFRDDESGPAKHVLQRIYYAERNYHDTHQRFTESLDEMHLVDIREKTIVGPPSIELLDGGFNATAVVRLSDGKTQQWHIRDDGRVWRDMEER